MNCLPKHRHVVVLLLLATMLWLGCGDDDEDNITDPGNQPPIINSLTAKPDTFFANQICSITVDAEDPDGDPLSYLWETRESWMLPLPSAANTLAFTNCCAILDTTTAFVHSIVSDDHGGDTRDSIQIWILPAGRK